MPINVNLDVMMAKRKISSSELADKLGITKAIYLYQRQIKGKPFGFLPLKSFVKFLTVNQEIS